MPAHLPKTRRPRGLASLFALSLAIAATPALAEGPATRPSLFDPSRHMRLADVHPGMKGYGLTVFHGTKIERFDVEVVDIAKNFNTGCDAILINCPGERTEHFNSVEGMSGSPVYLMAPDGTPRLIGAYAFGWDFAKDPLAGVQPIEYMLDGADPLVERIGSNLPEGPILRAAGTGRAHWTIRDVKLPEAPTSPAVSITLSGVSARTADSLAPLFGRYGVRPLFAAGGGPTSAEAAGAPAKIEPGSALVVPLVSGDTDMSALGTCTEVLGDRVYAFGHPFFGDGGVELPMAAGYVNTVIASLKSSFKMGGATQVLGVLRADTQVGVAGTFSGHARTIPVAVHVAYDDGSVDRTYHFQVVRHPKFTPLLTAASISAALNAVRELPTQCTLDASVTLGYPGHQELTVANRLANPAPAELLMGVLGPLVATGENPFARVYPESVNATITVHRETRSLDLLSASPTRKAYHPGDTVAIDVLCRPFHSAVETRRLHLKLPSDIEPGDHPLIVSDASRFLTDEQQARPDKFAADSLPELFDALHVQASAPNNAIYVRVASDPSGVAVGRLALPRLPASKVQLLTQGSAADVAPLIPSVVATLATDEVVSGEIELTISVVAEGKRRNPQQNPSPQPQHGGHPGRLPINPAEFGKLPGDQG